VSLELVELASGLDSPSYATTFPENENLLVVAEKATARISCIPMDQSTPQDAHLILDLASSLGAYQADANDFVGLSGLAFHPWYDLGREYRWLFVRYHVFVGGNEWRTLVDAFPVSSGLPVASVAGRVNVYTHVHPNGNTNIHYGSQIHFDPTSHDEQGNGMRLWIPMGDGLGPSSSCQCGTSGYEEMLLCQNMDSDFGKLIMVEVDVLPSLALSTPVVYARGLRNPYSFSVDPWTGDLWIADVGSSDPSNGAKPGEIHIFPGGPIGIGCPGSPAFACQSTACVNFGWPLVEGVRGGDMNEASLCEYQVVMGGPCDPGSSPPPPPHGCSISSYSAPLLGVDNQGTNIGEALLGGLLYRGSVLTGHQGRYFYGHFALTEVISIDPNNATSTGPERVNHTVDLGMDQPPGTPLFGQNDLRLISSTWEGEILLIQVEAIGSSLGNGKIYKVVPE